MVARDGPDAFVEPLDQRAEQLLQFIQAGGIRAPAIIRPDGQPGVLGVLVGPRG
jgi:hypothetical protein